MARFLVKNEEASEFIREILEGVPGGRIIEEDELRSLGVFFPEGEYGDILFLCDAGKIILPSYMGSSPVKGMHGYHPDAPCMYSVMQSNVDYGKDESSVTDIAEFLMPGFDGGKIG
jgi:hypothetical protein